MAWSTALKIGSAVIGGHFLLKFFGTDMDYNQALMMNYMRGHGPLGAHMKTYFADGLGSFMWGSRSASAMFGSFLFGGFGMGMGMGMFGAMNPYLHMMGGSYMMGAGLPYSPMAFGRGMWF